MTDEQIAAESAETTDVSVQPTDADAAVRAQAEKKYGKAGRNLPAAIAVGVGIGAVALLGLLFWEPLFILIVVAAVVAGARELFRALRIGGFRPPIFPAYVGGVAMVLSAYFASAPGLAVALYVTLVVVVLWRMVGTITRFGSDIAAGVFVVVYLFLLGGLAVLLLEPDDGKNRMIIFIAVAVSNDVGGYAAGVMFGKHPMAPSISPAKSWEGFVGSVILCTLVASGLMIWLLDASAWTGLVLGPAIAAAATTGDFAESMIKRDIGIKDMGSLLPGHGGALDRLDSLAVALPVAWLLLTLLAPIP